MDDSLTRREAARPRRASAAAAAAAELGANVSLQDGEVIEVQPPRESQPVPDRLSVAAGRMERRNSGPHMVHQRHMPIEPLRLPIPKKNKEKRALFQYVSTESREFEDMMTILTSSYIDSGSAGCFTYCKPRLIHSELLEKEFVEKRREMKADGRTDKELEESYGFLLTDTVKLPLLCEKGLCVGQSWLTVLGNPTKGVYLSRYSDLLQINSFTPGATGEIIIFKVMKGKVKSIYENMKNLLDPTPRFDSHISKNASKVTSLNAYRAFELTQQYFYEYLFDELRQRPRQVCPCAVVSFQFKGKDSSLPSKPLAPVRLNSQSAEGSKEQAQFTVWTGDLVIGDRVPFQISLRSFSPPFLPHRLPEKLKIGCLMRLDQVTKVVPSSLFSYNLYNNSQEVVKNGHCCSLLEVIDRNRSTTSVTKLLHELEIKRVVLVTPLTERGFLFLLSSVQMATPAERGESWKRCLQALFVFPETRDVARCTSRCSALESLMSGATVMPHLSQFIPALHHALLKARANPPPELSAGVERQAREYLVGLNDGKVRQYPMGEYDFKLDEQGKLFPPPKHHRVNMDGYLRSYLYNPALYLLSVARARHMVEEHCGPEEPQEVRPRKSCGGQRESTGKEVADNPRESQTNGQKIQQLIDLVLTCKRNAENEVRREEGGEGGLKPPGRKRRLEQETAERALKFLKASQGPGSHNKIPVEGSQVPSSPGSLASVISSVGLRDVDLREDGSELAAKLLSLLTGLNQAARGVTSQEEEQRESCPFDRLATKLGLPTNCDIDLRKQEELEEQTAGSVSSLEGFSPSSHSGEMNHHGAAGRGGGGEGGGGGGELGRRAGGYEEEEEEEMVPWVLIPITGLCSERYTQRDRNIPQDPRFQHLSTATSITTTTKPPRQSPALSPEPNPPASTFQCPSPEPSPPPSPSQCPSPDPSPPPSPSQSPSPEPSPPPSPSQCPSPEPSPPPSPSQCPCPQLSPPPSPTRCTSPQLSPPPSPSRCQPLETHEHNPLNRTNSRANEEHLAPTAFRDFAGMSQDRPQGKEKKNKEPSIFASIQPSVPPAPERRTSPSPPPVVKEKDDAKGEVGEVKEVAFLVKEKQRQPAETVKIQGEEEVPESKQDEEEVMDMIQEVAGEKEQKGEVKEVLGGSLFSPSASSPPARPLRDIDSIVDKHLCEFSSDMRLLLREESVHYSFPQSLHSTSNTETNALQHTLRNTSISQFSQYVSFYNPCPPVQDYVSSLQDSINSMLTEFGDSWPRHSADASQTDAKATLASTVSAFVASIRAANTNTGGADEVCAPCGELTAADASASVSQTPALSGGGEVWRPDAITAQFPDATESRISPAVLGTLSVPTSASGSVYNPIDTPVLYPPPNRSPQSHWKPQQSHTLGINRTIPHNSIAKTVHCTADVESMSSLVRSNSDVTLPGFSSASEPLAAPSHPSEPVSSSASTSVPTPPATALSSLISQLKPEVFNSLVEIIKDVKKNSLQFYLHSTEPGDQVYEDVKECLLKQGNVEQNPMAFLNQENSENRLLVIIKNKDIARHIHEIPSLVALKRHPSVVFVGIDTQDDIRNNSYNELFVSGGCIVSDELVLNPDFITHGRLAALLNFLEQHSSLENVWRWKVHCKTHKKLKEQARFRRDAANILDVLSAYQKRQIVELLPYHHCDMMNHQSPDLDCLLELQGRYTQYRHTIFLTESCFEKFPAYSSGGIVVAGIEEILHDFTRLVGFHDIKDKQQIMDDLLSTKGLHRQLSHGDSLSGSERSPSVFPEHIHPLSASDRPQCLLQQPGSGLLPLPHLSDQLVPDASCKDGGPSDTDYEVLRLAISQLRAERQAQQQQLDSQAELSIRSLKSLVPDPVHTGSALTTPPVGQGGPTESVMLTPGRKAVAATLDLIHSSLRPELGGEEERREHRVEPPTLGQRRRGGQQPADGLPVRAAGLLGGNQGPSYSPSTNQNTATVTRPGDQTNSTSVRREKADHRGEPVSSTSSCPVDGDRSRDTQSVQEEPIRGEGAPPGNGTAGDTKVTGSVAMVTGQEDNPNPALPRLKQMQLSQPHLQHTHDQQQQLQLNPSHPPHSQQQQWGSGLLQPPALSRLPGQTFNTGPMLRPLSALGRSRSLLGPTPVWPGGLGPAGAALVWGFQPASAGPALLGGYHNPAGQGSNRYRGGQRGGFNGM